MSPITPPGPGNLDELFRLFIDCAADYALYTLDAQGNVASWNRGAERLFGYREDEILGRSSERFYPRDNSPLQEMMRELALAGERGGYELQTRRIRKDGSRFDGYVAILPLRDADGAPAGYAAITRDVTEPQRLLGDALDKKRRLRSILETAVDAVVIIDEQGVVESINPAGERLFGYPAGEIVGRNVNLLMPAPYAAEHTGYLQKYLRIGEAKVIGVGREVRIASTERTSHASTTRQRLFAGNSAGWARTARKHRP